MSNNATLPPPRFSSKAPPSADGNRSDSNSGDGDSDTSLIHTESLGPREEGEGVGEGKSDNKQKRKRTSPKDQTTLEAEYKVNPKPNKAGRAEIVGKLEGLNEKEVQIWFQNRRQIQRRKSRPLLPHEIAAFGIRSLEALSPDLTSTPSFSSSQSSEEPATSSHEEKVYNKQQTEAVDPQEFLDLSEPLHSEEPVEGMKDLPTTILVSTPSIPHPTPSLERELQSEISGIEASSFSVSSVFKSFLSTPGYLANRWNAMNTSFSTPTSSQNTQSVNLQFSHPIHPSSCPEGRGFSDRSTPSCQVRLSMSLDGKAELISSDPSPPPSYALRPSFSGLALPQRRAGGLQRSQSALSFGPLSRVSAGGPLIPRLPRGRSRDALTWQFACDAESRDELTAQAENEANGSAVAAISLLRSTSKTALKPNTKKRNAPSIKYESNAQVKKPKFERALSSLARLQSISVESGPQSSKSRDGLLMHSPSGDSDKENWIPHEGGGDSRRPLPSGRSDTQHRSRPVLGDNFNPSTRSAVLKGGRNKRRKGANITPDIFEDQENSGKADEEVEKFMRGEVSPSKRGDFEGAQALLAIMGSGSWR